MSRDLSTVKQIHYHIRWLSTGTLDRQCHKSRADAEERAKELAKPNEESVIEAFGVVCPNHFRRLAKFARSA